MRKSFCSHGNVEQSYEEQPQNLESAKICVQSGKSYIKKEKIKNHLETDHKRFSCIMLLISGGSFVTINLFVTGEDLSSALFVESFL